MTRYYFLKSDGVEAVDVAYVVPELVARTEEREGVLMVHPDGSRVVPATDPAKDTWYGRFPHAG